jgi:hypothetical protein
MFFLQKHKTSVDGCSHRESTRSGKNVPAHPEEREDGCIPLYCADKKSGD